VQKFGLIAALSMFVLPAAAYSIMPIVLHRYPPTEATAKRRAPRDGAGDAPTMLNVAMRRVINHPAITLTAAAALLVAVGLGAYRLRASVQVLTLLDRDADLVRDYAWLEEHLGNLVPMEVVLTLPPERLRTGEEHAEADGQQYRLTMLERMELLRQIERRLTAFPQISRALSAATFAPPATDTGLAGVDRSGDYSKNKALEFHRDRLLATDYLQIETLPTSKRTTGRELWRMNARVAALADGAEPIDYGALQAQLTRAVEPVLAAYQQRDQIVRALHEQGKQLDGARVCVLFRAPDKAKAPPASVQEQALAELLMVSGVAPKGVSYFNLATFEQPGRGGPTQDDAFRQSAVASLRKQDAVVLASAPSDPVAAQIAGSGVYVVNVTHFSSVAEQADAPLLDDGGPRPIRAVFTGMAPIVDRTQRSLASGLIPGLWLAATLAAAAVTLGYMSLASGALTIGPALLPLAVTLGLMGWLGLKIDLGIAMTASVALGVALEGALHMVQWHRLGLATGLDRRRAAAWAGDRVSPTLIETAAIAAAGLAVLAWSGFTPLREFGVVMITVQAAALVANLFLVPAVLASPLGWFFAPVAVRRDDPLVPKLQAWWAAFWPAKASDGHGSANHSVVPLPKAPPAPHYGDPVPVRRTALPISTDERRELAEGPHSALHAKLQNLRRPRTGDSAAS
jgi:hypothetical protein